MDFTANPFGELALDPRHLNQADALIGLELDKEIHVAVGAALSAQHGPEEREPADVPPPAELGQLRLGDIEHQGLSHLVHLL